MKPRHLVILAPWVGRLLAVVRAEPRVQISTCSAKWRVDLLSAMWNERASIQRSITRTRCRIDSHRTAQVMCPIIPPLFGDLPAPNRRTAWSTRRDLLGR